MTPLITRLKRAVEFDKLKAEDEACASRLVDITWPRAGQMKMDAAKFISGVQFENARLRLIIEALIEVARCAEETGSGFKLGEALAKLEKLVGE